MLHRVRAGDRRRGKKRGYEVVATARRLETLADLDVDERLALDVTDDASVAAAVADAGPIDVLVNNAGISVGGPIEPSPWPRCGGCSRPTSSARCA